MKLILLRCGICFNWYRPVERFSCPVCACVPMRRGQTTRYYVRSKSLGKFIRAYRGLPTYGGIYSGATERALNAARILAEGTRA